MSLVPESFRLEKQTLGKFLRAIREEEFTSVRSLASAAGLDFSHIAKLELGNSEISVGRFLRLCYALQIPPGLVLENCSTVGKEIYFSAFYNNDEVKRMASDGGEPDSEKRNHIAVFLAGTALALSYILKSSNPLLLLKSFKFPVEKQRDNFEQFIAEELPHFGPAQRRAILRATITDTLNFLRRLKLIEDSFIESYLAGSPQREKPWIPAPVPAFSQIAVEAASPLKSQVELLIEGEIQHAKHRRKVGLGKEYIDKSSQAVNLGVMRLEVPTWPELKEDIKKMTAKRGEKKALADQIGVTRQVLGNWLSDDAQGAPNADLTLELLKRVKRWKHNK